MGEGVDMGVVLSEHDLQDGKDGQDGVGEGVEQP